MVDRPDKARRRELLRRVREEQRGKDLAELPLDNDELKVLFDHLDGQLPVRGCDHTRRLTVAFIRERGWSEEPILSWLSRHGGHCDCEVILNVEPFWLELTRGG